MDEDIGFRTRFVGPLVQWRGPSPFHFVPVPAEDAAAIRTIARLVSYGWGVIPVRGRIAATEFRTSLFPRDGGYLVPIRDTVRLAEGLVVGEPVTIELEVGRSAERLSVSRRPCGARGRGESLDRVSAASGRRIRPPG